MDLGIAGKVALVTGASKGLGRASAVALAREGAKLAICARGAEALADAEAAGLAITPEAYALVQPRSAASPATSSGRSVIT